MMNKIICFFFGHKWILDFNGPKKKRTCERCEKKQVWTIKFNRRDVFEGWL